MAAPFVHRVRVIYGDTDTAGIVYHANYLRYFEAARGEWLRHRGLPYAEIERRGLVWPVVELQTRFRQPARYDDLLLVEVRMAELGGASVTFDYVVTRESDGCLICKGSTRLGCVRRSGGVERIPDDVREALAGAG
jgi:acyl-CoA thioester hydrolase